MAGETFSIQSSTRKYHIYKEILDDTIGEELQCSRESDNANDRYAVAMK